MTTTFVPFFYDPLVLFGLTHCSVYLHITQLSFLGAVNSVYMYCTYMVNNAKIKSRRNFIKSYVNKLFLGADVVWPGWKNGKTQQSWKQI
jgi:hypothetical protein